MTTPIDLVQIEVVVPAVLRARAHRSFLPHLLSLRLHLSTLLIGLAHVH
jgi:hypothetical protein